MKIRKDGHPDKRIGKAMARKPRKNHPWNNPYNPYTAARTRAEQAGFNPDKAIPI